MDKTRIKPSKENYSLFQNCGELQENVENTSERSTLNESTTIRDITLANERLQQHEIITPLTKILKKKNLKS